MGKSQIVISCASSIATSTVVAMEVRELLEKHGLDANITQCSFAELDSRVEMLSPDLILVTGPVKQYGDIPVIVAMPLLTGINKEALQNKIIDTIKSIQK